MDPNRRVLPTLWLLLLPLTNTACGFLLVNGPPDEYAQMDYVSCTESNAGPILDFVWAGLNLLGAAAAAADQGHVEDREQIIAAGITWGVVSSVSGVVGLNKTRKCRTAKQYMAMQHREGERAARSGQEAPVFSVVVRPETVDTLRAIGAQVQLGAVAYDAVGEVIAAGRFKWSSSNDAIASVSNFGLVTAHTSGEVVIAANADNVVGTVRVVVVLQ